MLNFREELEKIKDREVPKDDNYRLAEEFLYQLLDALRNGHTSKFETNSILEFYVVSDDYNSSTIYAELSNRMIGSRTYHSKYVMQVFDAIKDIVKQSCIADVICEIPMGFSINF